MPAIPLPSPAAPEVARLLAGLAAGEPQAVYLVYGELVLAEPAAGRLAAALAAAAGCEVEVQRRPPSLLPLLDDLRTYSLFAPAKVALVVDSAILADKSAAAELIDDAQEGLPSSPGAADGSLSGRERQAASRLLQALRLFDVDPAAGAPAEAVARLPAWALEGGGREGGTGRRGKRQRGKHQVEELRAGLAGLLEAARREGIAGGGGGQLPELSAIVHGGLPRGHSLVLAERAVAADHPLVELLSERQAVARVGTLESGRGGAWEGLDELAAELARQTGAGISRDALAELARRTLRQGGEANRGGGRGVDADSSARLAGEYRKLANLAAGGKIDRRLVEDAVEDRGEEDVWQLLDAVAAGRGQEALDRLRRLLASAEDPQAARLSFFSLFASFCRHLTALRGMMRVARVPAGETNYGRFKDRHAAALQVELGTGGKNPLAGLHPFRLHRAYLAASRLPEPFLASLPSEVLETELRLKGESGEADAALAQLVAKVATGGR